MMDSSFIFALAILAKATLVVTIGSFPLYQDPEMSVYEVRQKVPMLNKTAPFPYETDRLPEDVLPEKYDLLMKPNTGEKTNFSGEVTIKLKCVHSTRYVILHSKDLNITKYRLTKLGSSQPLGILSIRTNPKNDQILFEPKFPLVSGEKYKLFMSFRGHMKDADIKANTALRSGFFRRSYIKTDGRKRTHVYAMLGYNSARTAFPCFNDPGFKSVFLITIEHDKSLKAVTNTPLAKQVPRSNGMVKSVFESSVKMSSYHVAFAISDFATNSTRTKRRGTKITIWAKQEVIKEVSSCLEVASFAVYFMEQYTGINYPYKELNIFAAQHFTSFEGFGLVFIWDRLVKWNNSKEYDKANEYYTRTLMPHAISHVWFGGLFTIKDWDEIWLYEGLSQFIQYFLLEQYNRSYNSEMLIVGDSSIFSLKQDSANSTTALNPKRRNTTTVSKEYLYLDKGAALFRMLQKLLEKTIFQEGIRRYLKKYKYKNSNAAELWDVFQSLEPSFDVKTVMHDWEYQSGYPVINIKYVGKDNNGNKVYTATQSRYVDGVTPDDPEYQAKYSKYSWYVPLWYIDSSSTKLNRVWMNKTAVNITVPGCAKWIKGNARQVGYYRVMYEQDMWDNLAKQLNDNHKFFSANDRNGLISDAYEFWEDGKDRVNITLPMKIMAYLKNERSTSPTRQAIEYINSIVKKIRLQQDVFKPFKKHLTYLFKDTLWSNTWEDPIFERKLFADLFDVLAYIGEQTVVNKGLQIVENWIKTGKYDYEIYVRKSVYEIAIRYGNKKHWHFMYQQYKGIANINTTLDIDGEQDSQRKHLLAGLSAAKSKMVIDKWLNDSYLESVSNKTDIWEKLEQVSRYNPGRYHAWTYFKTNFDGILERDARVNGNKTKSFLDFTKYFDEQCHLEDVEKFARSKPKLWSLQATNTSLDTIRTSIKWLQRNKQPLLNFLASQGHQG